MKILLGELEEELAKELKFNELSSLNFEDVVL